MSTKAGNDRVTRASASSPKGILFDFDGVLINSLPVMKLSFAAALREVYPGQRFNIDALFQDYCQYLGMGFDEIMSRMDLRPDMAGPFRQHSRYLARYVTLFDGAIGLLEWCQAQGLTLGIATGKDLARTLELLDMLNIRAAFGQIYASDSVDNPKPHPEMALRFMADTGLNNGDVIFVGDARADIECGKAAGCLTAAALWGYTPTDTLTALAPDYLFETPDDAIAQIGTTVHLPSKAKAS